MIEKIQITKIRNETAVVTIISTEIKKDYKKVL